MTLSTHWLFRPLSESLSSDMLSFLSAPLAFGCDGAGGEENRPEGALVARSRPPVRLRLSLRVKEVCREGPGAEEEEDVEEDGAEPFKADELLNDTGLD